MEEAEAVLQAVKRAREQWESEVIDSIRSEVVLSHIEELVGRGETSGWNPRITAEQIASFLTKPSIRHA